MLLGFRYVRPLPKARSVRFQAAVLTKWNRIGMADDTRLLNNSRSILGQDAPD
jgi:hypothetical protein